MEPRSVSQAKLLQAVQAIRHGLEGMMANYYARAPRNSIGLDETAEAICETSGIPNPALFRVVLRKTISSLSSRPELLGDGYHVMSCIIWCFCFLQPKAMIMSIAKLYTSDPDRKLIAPDEVRALVHDIMLNDPKKEQQSPEEPPKYCLGLQEYSTAVARISQTDTASTCSEVRLSLISDGSEDIPISPDGHTAESPRVVSSMDELLAAPIDIGVFIRYFTRRHPGALWPLFIIQKQLRCMFLGEDYWKKILQPRNVLEFFRTVAIPEECEAFMLPEPSGAEEEPQLSPSAQSSSSSTSPRSIWLKLSSDSESSPRTQATEQDLVIVLCAVLSHLQDVQSSKSSGSMRRTHSHSSMTGRQQSRRRDRSASPRRHAKAHSTADPSSSSDAGSGPSPNESSNDEEKRDGEPQSETSSQQQQQQQQSRPQPSSASARPRLQSTKRHILRDDTEPNSPVYTKDISKDNLRQRNRSEVHTS